MTQRLRGTCASNHLDLVRGLAAVAVLIYHVRYDFYLDFGDLEDPSRVDLLFYTITSFGHDAVMVFFVLSGFFIVGSVRRDYFNQEWSWRRYLVSRLTRLYVVLLPGLFLTFLWDRLGIQLFGTNPIYTGEFQEWGVSIESQSGIDILVGNMLFVQTILVPPYGSNGPLWSLANEFWYYMLYPCLFLFWHTSGLRLRLRGTIYLLCGIAIASLVGPLVLAYFPMWLMGAITGRIPRSSLLTGRRPRNVAMVLAFGLFGFLTVCGHITGVKNLLGGSSIVMDYLTATGFCVLMYVLLHDDAAAVQGWYTRLATQIAGLSYSLYVLHRPLLVFLRGSLVTDEPWRPSPSTIGTSVLITVAVFLYALFVARLTEFKTESVRDFVSRQLMSGTKVNGSRTTGNQDTAPP